MAAQGAEDGGGSGPRVHGDAAAMGWCGKKFEGLITSAKASENKPCMIKLEYNAAQAKALAPGVPRSDGKDDVLRLGRALLKVTRHGGDEAGHRTGVRVLGEHAIAKRDPAAGAPWCALLVAGGELRERLGLPARRCA